MEVIVTDTHTRMALAVVRELGRKGYKVTSVTRASKPSLCHASRYAAKHVTLPDEDYAEALLALAGTGKPVLLPAGAYTLNAAAERRDAFLSAFRMLLPEHDALNTAGDKPAVMRKTRELGLLTPDEYPPDAPVFPCVIKYRNGEALQLPAQKRYAIVNSDDEYIKKLDGMREKGDVFVSQYVQGGAYGVSAVLDKDSEPLALFCHTRVREYPLSGGPACCAESIWHASLAEAALQLLKAMKLSGMAMVEFKGSPEHPYILEINPRVWGTYPLSFLSGADMSVTYVRAAMGEPLPPNRSCRYKTGVRMQYLANDLMCGLSGLRTGRGFDIDILGDFLSPHVKGGVFDSRDWPGTLAYVKALCGRRP